LRFDTPVYFRRIERGAYDPTTGNYGADIPIEEMRLASVTSTGVKTLQLVYGAIREGSFTIRLQNHYNKPFDDIRIGNKTYRVDMTRPLRVKQAFVVSEVQQNAQNQN